MMQNSEYNEVGQILRALKMRHTYYVHSCNMCTSEVDWYVCPSRQDSSIHIYQANPSRPGYSHYSYDYRALHEVTTRPDTDILDSTQ